MALRFNNASTEANYLLRASGVPSGNFTYCCWYKLITTADKYATIFYRGDSSSGEWPFFGMNTSEQLHLYTNSQDASGTTVLSAGTWYHIALVRNSSTDWKCYLNGVQEISATAETSLTPTRFALGSDIPFLANNGHTSAQAAGKLYDTNISVAEIIQESRSIAPSRTANLVAWFPMCAATVAGNLIDYTQTGNGTQVGTLALEDGPPIPWNVARRHRIYVPSAGPPPSGPRINSLMLAGIGR